MVLFNSKVIHSEFLYHRDQISRSFMLQESLSFMFSVARVVDIE